MSRTLIQPQTSSRGAAALSALTLALLAACGGGGSDSPAPAGADPTGGGGAGTSTTPSRSETNAEKGGYWERGAGLRPNLAHLIGAADSPANVQSLSPQEAAWVRERAAAAATATSGEGSAKTTPAGATLQAAAVPRRTVTGLQTNIFHTAAATVLQPLNLTARVIEAFAPNGTGGFEVIPATAKRADGTYTIAGVPEGPHWVHLGNRYVWTSSGFVDWSQDLYGRADVDFAAAATRLQINAGNLAPWQTNDSLAWVVPQQGASLQIPLTVPSTTNAPRIGEVALGNFGLDLLDTNFGGLLDAAKGDLVYINQLVTQGASGVRVLARSMVLPPLTTPSGSTTPVNSGFLDIAPSAKLQLRWDRAAFARQAGAVHPGIAASDSGMAISAFATSPALGTPFDAYSLLEFNTLGTTDLDFGTLRYGNPFPADWNRVVDAFVVFTKNYLAPGATVSEPLARGLSISTLIDPATRNDTRMVLAPGVTPPRAPLINGRSLFNNQLAVGMNPTLSWSAPESGVPDHYSLRVLELRLDGTRSVFVTAGRLSTGDTSMVLPPGILQAGKLYVITIAAIKGGTPVTQPSRNGLPISFATTMSAIVSP